MPSKRIRKIVITAGVLSGMLFGTTSTVSASYQDQVDGLQQVSYQKAKKKWKKVYKLAFFENESSDSDRQYWKLGWYQGGKLKQYTLSDGNGWQEGNEWQEIVDPNLKTPYVVLEGNSAVIHRPPYNMYNQPAVSGTVTAKE